MLWYMVLSLGCICWNLRHMPQFFTLFPMSLLILTQYTDLHASSLVFLIPMWLTWSCPALLLQPFRDDYVPTLHDYTIYDCKNIFVGPVWSYADVELVLCVWPTCNYNIFNIEGIHPVLLLAGFCDMYIHSRMSVCLVVSILMSMSQDRFIFVFFMIVTWQPICNKLFLVWVL